MLRDAGVRTKLLAVLAIPTVLLILVTSLLVANQVSSARRAGQVAAMTDVAVQVNRVVHGLQTERSATLSYLADPTSDSLARMKQQRHSVDVELTELQTRVANSPANSMSQSVSDAVSRSTAAHGELKSARASIDAHRYYATETDVFYTRVIKTDLQLPGVVANWGTPELAQRLLAYEAVSSAIEYGAHERDLLEVAERTGGITEVGFGQASALVSQQNQALLDFRQVATPAVFNRLDNRLASADNFGIDQVRRSVTDLLTGTDPDPKGAETWVTAADTRINPMVNTESQVVTSIADLATSTQSSERSQAFLLAGAGLFAMVFAIALALVLSQRITRPLRRLTVAAGEIGDELPRMVERMQTPGEGPGVQVEPIPVESRDEVGQLAEAFNTVNWVTVSVAKEQAALRASIAEMFVNVARRNQVLLGRQLSQLDVMEAGEENPDVLEHLFKLDHLATRMRRNAESLLVLAGIDSTRRFRHALPLSDVIRAAVSEIETFDRIDLSVTDDPNVSGRLVLPIAHLLAELLENATHFSNPGTRVVVSTGMTGGVINLTITDYGLGMSDEELADAQEKFDRPSSAEIVASQRLGLFVVGRLAQRIGATVTLRRGRSSGTVATVALPLSVFEGLAPVQLPADEVVEATAVGAEADTDVIESRADVAAPEDEGATKPKWRFRSLGRRRPAVAPVDAPSAEDVVAEHALDEVAAADEVAPDERTADEAVADETVADETVADETVAVELAAEHVAADVVADGVVTDEVVTDEVAVGEEPVADEPAAEAPVAEAEVDAPPAEAEGDAPPAEAESVLFEQLVAESAAAEAAVAATAHEDSVAAQFADIAGAPLAEAEAPAEPPPAQPFVFAPAIDVLPGRPLAAPPQRAESLKATPTLPESPASLTPPAAPTPPPPAPTPAPVAAVVEKPAPEPAVEPVAGPPAEPAAEVAPALVFESAGVDAPPAARRAAPPEVTQEVAEVTQEVAEVTEEAAEVTDVAEAAEAADVAEAAEVPQVPEVPAVAEVAEAPAVTPTPALPVRGKIQELAPSARPEVPESQLQRAALTELRGLYAPTVSPGTAPTGPPASAPPSAEPSAPGGLTRRTPRATSEVADEPTTAPPPARQRSAAEVRGMLSGFRAGIERGRTTAPAPDADADDTSLTGPED